MPDMPREGFTITVPGTLDANEVRAAAISGIQAAFNAEACRQIGVSTVSTLVAHKLNRPGGLTETQSRARANAQLRGDN